MTTFYHYTWVTIYQKQWKIETWLQLNTNKKSYQSIVYHMVPLRMTLLFETSSKSHTLENRALICYDMFTQASKNVHGPCVNCGSEDEGFHRSQAVTYMDKKWYCLTSTTNHWYEVTYGLSNSSTSDDLEWRWSSFFCSSISSLSKYDFCRVTQQLTRFHLT